MRHNFASPPSITIDAQAGLPLHGGGVRPSIRFWVTEIVFEGTVPSPYLLLNINAELLPVQRRPNFEICGVRCDVICNVSPHVGLGTAQVVTHGQFYATTKGKRRATAYVGMPISLDALRAIEQRRTDGLSLVISIRPEVRMEVPFQDFVGETISPTVPVELSRDLWLGALRDWEYTDRWIVEVPAGRLGLDKQARDLLEHGLQLLREGRQRDALNAVVDFRRTMDATDLCKKLEVLEDETKSASMRDTTRSRADRLELLRGALWHAVNTAAHPGHDFEDWDRKDAELVFRSLVALLAGL